MKRFVIIGGSDAGISAALRAREVDPSWQVTVVVADAFPNYSICGLPFFLSGETPRAESLAHRTRRDIESQGIELLLDIEAEHVDATEHHVLARQPDGNSEVLEYDRLLIATGALPARPPIRGLDTPAVYQLHSMAKSFAVREHLISREPKSAVIVGGGYIGVEMADAFRHRGLSVTLCESGSSVLQTVDPAFGLKVEAELVRNGVEVHPSTSVELIEPMSGGLRVRGSGGLRAEAELVLVVTGVRPCVELGKACGVDLGARGAFRVTRRMETNLPDIYAAGDCVETHHRLMAGPVYLPLGTTAHKQGRVAGENAVGGNAQFEGSLGTQVVKIFDAVVGRTGLRDEEAVREGFEPVTVETTASDHKAYYPGATDVLIRVTADRRSRGLLGAQILGSYGAEISKRLDVFATALFHRMSVDGIAALDLSYTPPLSSPWDPVQTSCLAVARELDAPSRATAKSSN